MVTYEYRNISYTKRPITDHILLHVIAQDPAAIGTDAYEEAALVTKGAEQASQMDACPMIGRDRIVPVYNRIRKDPGMRARDVETGSAVSCRTFDDFTAEDAACQIACGTLANVAASYSGETAATMLAHGILPLLCEEVLPADTFVYIRDIRRALMSGETILDAYIFAEGDFEKVKIGVAAYGEEKLEKILN